MELILVPFSIVIISVRPLHLPVALFTVVVKLTFVHRPIVRGFLSMSMFHIVFEVSDILLPIEPNYFPLTILHTVLPVSLSSEFLILID